MMNQTTDLLNSFPALELLIKQSRSNDLKRELVSEGRKRSSSEVFESSSSTSSTQSVKRLRPTVSYKSKVHPSKVGLVSYEPNDVLCGRGGGTNQHEGNCFFRSLINKNRERYLRAKKNDKPSISLAIVNTIRQRNGRFLKKDEESGLWFEIGDALAREKTSQALRQRAPEYRKQLFEQDFQTQKSLSQLVPPESPPRSPIQVQSKSQELVMQQQNIIREALRATVRQKEIQQARQVLRLHQKLQAIKALELELMLQSSNRYLRSL